ncbi:N/A [soil metagenome]
MAVTHYLDHLAAVPLFAACSKRDLQKIGRASDEIDVKPGRVLIDQGQTGREAFVILEGTALVRRNGRKVTTLGAGDYFGELALLDRGPRTATVEAETPMRVLVLGQREFAGVLDEVPGLAHKLMASLARRIRDLDAKMFT